MKAIGDEIIIPYRNKLMPKSIRFEGALLATVNNDTDNNLFSNVLATNGLALVMALGHTSAT